MVPPRRDHVDTSDDEDGVEEAGPAAEGVVQYEEDSNEDNDEDTDDELFMETIRRGAIAVQQRRRRLLERGANHHHHHHEEHEDEDSTIMNSDVLVIQRPLQRSLLQATSSSSAPGESSLLLLLYCGPPSSPSSSSSQPLLPKGFFYRLGQPESHTLNTGCGKLICARGKITKSTKNAGTFYESDAPPSQDLLDWLEIIPSKDDQLNWPHLCDCVQASLGCRNCGNNVGSATLFKCGPCRRSATTTTTTTSSSSSSSSWLFHTSLVKPRQHGVPIPAYYVPDEDSRGHVPADSGSQKMDFILPSVTEDYAIGLAGSSQEWQLRSESLFNASPIPSLRGWFKERSSAASSFCELEQGQAVRPSRDEGLVAIDGQTSSDTLPSFNNTNPNQRILTRARALRRDLRAYIEQARVSTVEGEESTSSILQGSNNNNSGVIEYSNEMEFRRQRRAEVEGSVSMDDNSGEVTRVPAGPVGR